jgi:hypothetical protein
MTKDKEKLLSEIKRLTDAKKAEETKAQEPKTNGEQK